jgi:hypothetical protein
MGVKRAPLGRSFTRVSHRPCDSDTEPARHGPGSPLGARDIGGRVNGQRVAEQGCRVSRGHSSSVHDPGQSVAGVVEIDLPLLRVRRQRPPVRAYPRRSGL